MIKKVFMKSLAMNKMILRQFVESMSDQEINRRIRDYWTIYEHLEHLVETQEISLRRVEIFIEQESPAIVPFVPDETPNTPAIRKPVSELLQVFDSFRDKQLKLIGKAPKEVWRKVGTHGQYSNYSFEILLRHTLLHDSFHMARMEQLWIMKEEFLMELNSN
ncbi:MAG: hypothetical protein A2Z99_16490 [Treponema sp. GWB1_62_6]|nr:MAG: hypothetical protein A2001_10455 [Treponema sp. GWC1_61_84]OHE65613.1 MAG: hypothetical protein A2Y36_06785 [Treponema sp. GWA1_62_8]OHE68900.1 MAG: hypothetical protein A2Z99_16490 [Treponema sp. GWB1_62_6]OHE72680.1 MAG: hypothetical protein A2413_12320 [Treponema sp. RIFOXYC1_FULL_61_9]HCM27743.1 hypothetical protein [Treponema sp.]